MPNNKAKKIQNAFDTFESNSLKLVNIKEEAASNRLFLDFEFDGQTVKTSHPLDLSLTEILYSINCDLMMAYLKACYFEELKIVGAAYSKNRLFIQSSIILKGSDLFPIENLNKFYDPSSGTFNVLEYANNNGSLRRQNSPPRTSPFWDNIISGPKKSFQIGADIPKVITQPFLLKETNDKVEIIKQEIKKTIEVKNKEKIELDIIDFISAFDLYAFNTIGMIKPGLLHESQLEIYCDDLIKAKSIAEKIRIKLVLAFPHKDHSYLIKENLPPYGGSISVRNLQGRGAILEISFDALNDLKIVLDKECCKKTVNRPPM